MIKGNEEFIISLYKESIEELTSDLLLVKHEETKKLIQDEINYCNKRIKDINKSIEAL